MLTQIEDSVDFVDQAGEYDLEMYRHKKMKSTPEIALNALKAINSTLESIPDDEWTMEKIHEELLALPKQLNLKNGQVLWPGRTALSGKQFTPGGAIEIAYILGKEESMRRIDVAIERLEKAINHEE